MNILSCSEIYNKKYRDDIDWISRTASFLKESFGEKKKKKKKNFYISDEKDRKKPRQQL